MKRYDISKVRTGYKKYSDFSKIYCLDSQRFLFAVQALVKDKIKFTMSQYGYSEIMPLSIETALDNVTLYVRDDTAGLLQVDINPSTNPNLSIVRHDLSGS